MLYVFQKIIDKLQRAFTRADTFESCDWKMGFNACAESVVPDKHEQSDKAYQGQHFPIKLDFLLGRDSS